jgi:hypothetical protein
LPHAAAHQAPLHDDLSDPRVKGSHPINWTPELTKAFDAFKASLSHATLLAHPDTSALLALVTDASTSASASVTPTPERLHQTLSCPRQPTK